MRNNKELTVEEIKKANKTWKIIKKIKKCMSNCGIIATRIDTNKCVIYVREIDTHFEESMENTLDRMISRLIVELMSNKELISQLRISNKQLEYKVEKLQEEIIRIETEQKQNK